MLIFNQVTREFHGGVFGTHKTNAVKGVSFVIRKQQCVGLVGESGCGKSTIARMAVNLVRPTSGSITLEQKNIHKLRFSQAKAFRRNVQMIFQHPQQTFNPRMKLYETIAEPVRVHKLVHGRQAEKQMILQHMETVGLTEDIFKRYPHEISGGQAQRIAILRILMLRPKLIVADEPTSMLDVSVQAQILELLKTAMKETGSSMLFISHDFDVVKAMCDTIMVMKDGEICETSDSKQIFENPRHDYTKFLVQSAVKAM